MEGQEIDCKSGEVGGRRSRGLREGEGPEGSHQKQWDGSPYSAAAAILRQQEVKDASCSRAKGEDAICGGRRGGPRVFIHEGNVESRLESKKVGYICLREYGGSGLPFWLLMIEDSSSLTPDGISHLGKSGMGHTPSPHATWGNMECPSMGRAICGIFLR